MKEYIDFLRYCLNDNIALNENVKDIDWKEMMVWARQQAILGVIYGGIRRAGDNIRSAKGDGKESLVQIPFDVLMKWVGYAQQIENRNRVMNQKVGEVCEQYRQDGFRTCILKGQGAALYYPNPLLRISGDIDIWLEGGQDKIMRHITNRYGKLVERYHHVELPVEDGIAVEVHFTPSYMYSWKRNKNIQKWFLEHANAQFENKVKLEDCKGEVAVPTMEFNIIYMLSHIYRHLFSEGIGLRQIIDYYYLLRSNERNLTQGHSKSDITATLKSLGLYNFARALMWVLHKQLGLEEKFMIVVPDEKEGLFLWQEIMIGGNFGQFDTRLGKKDSESKLRRYFRMTVRNFRFVTHYPSEALCEPVFRTWHFFWRLAHR